MPPSLVLALLASASVSLEPSAATRELAPLLVQELGSLAALTSTSAHVVRLRELDAHLALELRTARGEPLLARSFGLEAGRAAALRGVVVAIVQALAVEAAESRASTERGADAPATRDAPDARAAAAATVAPTPSEGPRSPVGPRAGLAADDEVAARAPPSPPEPRPAARAPDVEPVAVDGPVAPGPAAVEPGRFPAGLTLGLAGGVVVAGGPQLTLELDARWPLTPALAVGAALGVHGLLCCTTTDTLTGGTPGLERTLRRGEALVIAAWHPLALGPLELGAAAGAGVVWQSLEATPLTFVGTAPTHALELWSPAARLALEVSLGLGAPWSAGAVGWTLGLGAELSGALSTGLPAGFPGQGLTTDTGIIHPLGYLRVQLGLL